jgi:hypothetical protein
LKGIIIRGENNDNHKWSSSFVFHRNINREKKRHKDNGYVPSSSCLKGAETIGEDDNVSMIIIISVFQRSNNKENKKDMKMTTVSLSLCLRGARIDGEDEMIIDCCCLLLFFTKAMTMRNMMT